METEIQRIKQRFNITGNDKALNYAIGVAIQVAPTPLTVLITGENGTGKESFSKIIHSLSPRKHNKLIAINCGAIPEGTIDSELFGHEKGAFTGAIETRKGYFETVDGGTIFLDEIGEMPLATQARLLRILEYGEYIKVGSSKVQRIDVRIITATNIDLLDAVNKGKFREDLYYRLCTVPIHVPALRKREDDIFLLFRKFAVDFADRYHTKPTRLTGGAKNKLMEYRFPGNIRQLKNLVEQISILEPEKTCTEEILSKYLPPVPSKALTRYQPPTTNAESDTHEREILYKVLLDMKHELLELKELIFELLSNGEQQHPLLEKHLTLFKNLELPEKSAKFQWVDSQNPDNKTYTYEKIQEVTPDATEPESFSIEKKEKELISKALKQYNNKRKHAAESLGISERTLYRKIKQYEIEN